MLQTTLGWLLIIFPGFLYIGQTISSINFKLAQKLGLQENPEESDKILQRAERYAAYWDLITLGWLPVAGILMIVDHPYWPLITLIGGVIYVDTSGREAAKNLSLQHEGIRTGTPSQKKFFFFTYILMAVIGITVSLYSIGHL